MQRPQKEKNMKNTLKASGKYVEIRVKPPSSPIPTERKTNRLICRTFLPRVPSCGRRSVVAGWLVRRATGHQGIPHPRLVNTVVRFSSTLAPPFPSPFKVHRPVVHGALSIIILIRPFNCIVLCDSPSSFC